MARASRVLPAPGGPTISTLCPPAAATSRARLTCSWPLISRKSVSDDDGHLLRRDRRLGRDGLLAGQMGVQTRPAWRPG